MPDSPAILALGDPRASQLGSNASEVERHRVGMDFYKRHWPVNRLGRARYLQGPYSFDIPRVSSVMGSLDRGDPGRGIYAWDVSAFPMDGERVPHRVARDELFALLAQMRRAGWRRVLSHSSPRLAGEDALRYALVKHGIYSLDPDYLPSFDQWMQISRHLPYWILWADGSYATVQVMDEPALRNPERPGVYLFSLAIDSESSNFERYFTEVDDKRRWKQLIPPELERLHKLRASTEAALSRQGYTIDTSYQDPPILALRTDA